MYSSRPAASFPTANDAYAAYIMAPSDGSGDVPGYAFAPGTPESYAVAADAMEASKHQDAAWLRLRANGLTHEEAYAALMSK